MHDQEKTKKDAKVIHARVLLVIWISFFDADSRRHYIRIRMSIQGYEVKNQGTG